MDLGDLSDQDKLVLGLRFRLKHIRIAIGEAQAGRVPEGFDFAPAQSKAAMLAELATLETRVLEMLRQNGGEEALSLN